MLKLLKKWIADSYEYLGLIIVSSLAWCGLALACLAVVALLSRGNYFLLAIGLFTVFVLILSPGIASVFYLARKISAHDDPNAGDLLKGFKELLLPSWALGLAQALVTSAILSSIYFYLTRGRPILTILGTFFIYVFFLWVLSALYHYPIMIEQRAGVLRVLKRSMLITLDNLVFTVGVFFVIILLTCLCAVTLIGIVLLYPGMACLLQARALRALFVKYELLEPEIQEHRDTENNGNTEDVWKVGSTED